MGLNSRLLLSRSVMSDSLQPRGMQHAKLPCPSPPPGAYSNSCPLSQWCHPTISISVIPFSSCLQSFPALGSFLMSQLFASGGQSIGASAPVLLRKSVPRQVDKKSRVPEEENGVWGSWNGDRGLEFSRRRKGQTSFFSCTFLSLSHIKWLFL